MIGIGEKDPNGVFEEASESVSGSSSFFLKAVLRGNKAIKASLC
jgi:hypothetical protein